jgi:plasmid stabilization system protein ParE
MERQIIWTERASGALEAIVRYIARLNPRAAGQIGFAVYDRVQILHDNPEAGSILNELRAGGWRQWVFRRWKIIPSDSLFA